MTDEPRLELVSLELRKCDLPGGRGMERHVDPDPAGNPEVARRVELKHDLDSGTAVRDGEQRGLAGVVSQSCEHAVCGVDEASIWICRAGEPHELVPEDPTVGVLHQSGI